MDISSADEQLEVMSTLLLPKGAYSGCQISFPEFSIYCMAETGESGDPRITNYLQFHLPRVSSH